MPAWPVRDAKARFSEMLDTCLKEGPRVVSRRGVEAAILVPIDQWRRMKGDGPTLKDLLLSGGPRAEIPLPPRGQYHRRKAAAFE